MKVPHRGGGRARSRAWRGEVPGRSRPGKGRACEFPRAHMRGCGGGNRPGREWWRGKPGLPSRRIAATCGADDATAGAIPWRSIYRRCSSRAVGSVRESAGGATNWHRALAAPASAGEPAGRSVPVGIGVRRSRQRNVWRHGQVGSDCPDAVRPAPAAPPPWEAKPA